MLTHGPIYREASRWSADRMRAQNPRFRVEGNTEPEIYFTGEMVSCIFPQTQSKQDAYTSTDI
jgi:hypothetical protein